ncbi:uncharacterized protein LOC6732693 isoform X2 [Drosophila simulans]|uniref:Uncharacterized protein, isoform C n=1 Tax=Drosophila simulans TaxID=7240 RepID=A0A0J9R3L0_DROSI|nr:uncharacterized protein LOC6732693 isoform X2 [Drosophila simulans]KMY90847.1 uncharacterized protein Dsimw501_GD24147, isoform C [Drosophila simulans]
MKFIYFFIVALILVAYVESMVFVKILHSDKYPGQCYPIHVRVGKKKQYDVFALQPGEEVSDPNTCGVQVCMNAEGLTHVYYYFPAVLALCRAVAARTIRPWTCC